MCVCVCAHVYITRSLILFTCHLKSVQSEQSCIYSEVTGHHTWEIYLTRMGPHFLWSSWCLSVITVRIKGQVCPQVHTHMLLLLFFLSEMLYNTHSPHYV